jgi:hypothetical protein
MAETFHIGRRKHKSIIFMAEGQHWPIHKNVYQITYKTVSLSLAYSLLIQKAKYK